MRLTSIEDLNRPQLELDPLIKEAQTLGHRYYDLVANEDETYEYRVVDFGEGTRTPGFHASEITGCHRQLVYSVAGCERRKNPCLDVNMKMRFRIGTAVHAMIQAEFTRIAANSGGHLHFEEEIKISPEHQEVAKQWNIHSHIDGIFTFSKWYPEHNRWGSYMRVGLEIKTQSAGAYEDNKEPLEYHKDQTCVYMKCLDLPLMWVLYYNKSNSNITTPYSPYLFKYDPDRWEKITRVIQSGSEYVRKGELPPREEGKPCTWCSYAWHCQPEMLKKKQAYKSRSTTVSPALRVRR